MSGNIAGWSGNINRGQTKYITIMQQEKLKIMNINAVCFFKVKKNDTLTAESVSDSSHNLHLSSITKRLLLSLV